MTVDRSSEWAASRRAYQYLLLLNARRVDEATELRDALTSTEELFYMKAGVRQAALTLTGGLTPEQRATAEGRQAIADAIPLPPDPDTEQLRVQLHDRLRGDILMWGAEGLLVAMGRWPAEEDRARYFGDMARLAFEAGDGPEADLPGC
ncbi:MAG: hypothetical protein JWO98_2613 [Frankiales bacterium]|nr:hypothetical protein [Frankiales bacterium]